MSSGHIIEYIETLTKESEKAQNISLRKNVAGGVRSIPQFGGM